VLALHLHLQPLRLPLRGTSSGFFLAGPGLFQETGAAQTKAAEATAQMTVPRRQEWTRDSAEYSLRVGSSCQWAGYKGRYQLQQDEVACVAPQTHPRKVGNMIIRGVKLQALTINEVASGAASASLPVVPLPVVIAPADTHKAHASLTVQPLQDVDRDCTLASAPTPSWRERGQLSSRRPSLRDNTLPNSESHCVAVARPGAGNSVPAPRLELLCNRARVPKVHSSFCLPQHRHGQHMANRRASEGLAVRIARSIKLRIWTRVVL
jgi:hypothetical protein